MKGRAARGLSAVVRFAGFLAACLSVVSCGGLSGHRTGRVACALNACVYGRVVIPVTINGQPARMLLDPGLNVDAIRRSSAGRLKLSIEVGARRSIWGYQGVSADNIAACGISFGRTWLFAATGPVLGIARASGVDGVIGMATLARVATLFDFQKGRVQMWRGGNVSVAEILRAGYAIDQTIPEASDEDGYFAIAARINGSPAATLRLDLDGYWPTIDTAEPLRFGVDIRRADRINWGPDAYATHLSRLQLSQWSLWHIPCLVRTGASAPAVSYTGSRIWVIGGVMVLDAPAHNVYVAHAVMPAPPQKPAG